MGDPATRRWAHQTGAKNSTKRKPVGWIPQIGDPHWRNRETAMVQVQRAMEVGMAATGRYMKPDGEITYEYKDVSSAPARNNPDRTAYMGTRRRAGTSTDPPQAVLRGRHDELYGPNTGQHASGVDPPWLVVAQRVSAVGYAAGKVQGRRRWDGGGDMHGEPGGDDKGKGKGRSRSRSRGRGKGRPRAGGRREPPGALRARRNGAMGHYGRHPLDGTPLARGAWVGAAEEAPAPLGGAQRQVGLGDPFWQARPAEELYRPRKPWRQPPSKRQPKPRAAAQKTQDEEEWLRQLAEDGDAVALIAHIQHHLKAGTTHILEGQPPQKVPGLDINAATWAGWTALHYAAACGHDDCVVALLEAKADPDVRVVLTGNTPYMIACESGHAGCVEALVAFGCDQEIIDDRRRTGRQLATRPAGQKLATKRTEVLEMLAQLELQAEEESAAVEEEEEEEKEGGTEKGSEAPPPMPPPSDRSERGSRSGSELPPPPMPPPSEGSSTPAPE